MARRTTSCISASLHPLSWLPPQRREQIYTEDFLCLPVYIRQEATCPWRSGSHTESMACTFSPPEDPGGRRPLRPPMGIDIKTCRADTFLCLTRLSKYIPLRRTQEGWSTEGEREKRPSLHVFFPCSWTGASILPFRRVGRQTDFAAFSHQLICRRPFADLLQGKQCPFSLSSSLHRHTHFVSPADQIFLR